MAEKFEGTFTDLITPMHEDGRINYDELERLIGYQITYGTNNLYFCGITGQSLTLNWGEHTYIINTMKVTSANKYSNTRGHSNVVPVVAGCDSNNIEEAVKLTKQALDDGAAATLHVLHVTRYNMPSQLGLIDYFSKVAEAAPKPVIMHDDCSMGHPLYEPATRIYLGKTHPNIIGIIDATGIQEVWKETRRIARENGFDKHSFKIISGDDPNTYRMMSDPEIEGVGVISVWSNPFPQIYTKEVELLLDGKYEEAKKIDDSLTELNKIVGVRLDYELNINNKVYPIKNDGFRNPEAVQFAAYLLGMIESPRLRSPLGFLPKDGQEKVGKTLLDLYVKNPEYFDPINEFFKPKPSIGDRLRRYKPA